MAHKKTYFIISSVVTGGIYMGILFIMRTFLSLNPSLSVTIAYLSAMTFYFVINKKVVFPKQNKDQVYRQIFHFLIIIAINYVITLIITTSIFHFTNEVYSGSVIAGIVTTTITYFVFDKIIFKVKPA